MYSTGNMCHFYTQLQHLSIGFSLFAADNVIFVLGDIRDETPRPMINMHRDAEKKNEKQIIT